MIRHQADTRPRNRADRPQLRGKLVDSWDDRREGPVALAAARTANAAQSGPFSLSATTSHVRGQPGRGGRTVRRTAVVGFWLAAAACHTRGSCIPLGAMVWYYLAPLWSPHRCCKGGAGPRRQRRRPQAHRPRGREQGLRQPGGGTSPGVALKERTETETTTRRRRPTTATTTRTQSPRGAGRDGASAEQRRRSNDATERTAPTRASNGALRPLGGT